MSEPIKVSISHRFIHLLQLQPSVAISEWRADGLYIATRCMICGRIGRWHKRLVRPGIPRTSENRDPK